jgi:hypothetical protein
LFFQVLFVYISVCDRKKNNHENMDEPVVSADPPRKLRMSGNVTRLDYNILSNLPFSEHHALPPDERPKQHPKPDKLLYIPVARKPRDYDIISTQYREDHEGKSTVCRSVLMSIEIADAHVLCVLLEIARCGVESGGRLRQVLTTTTLRSCSWSLLRRRTRGSVSDV